MQVFLIRQLFFKPSSRDLSSFYLVDLLSSNTQLSWQKEQTWKMPLGDLEGAYITSIHILLARTQSVAKLHCKGCWEM